MRTPPRRAAEVALAGAVVAALAAAGGVARAGGEPPRAAGGAGAAPLAVVVLRAPSVADRVAARGGPTSEEAQRGWSADAFHAQEGVLGRLARAGQPVLPLRRLTRALDAFVARVDAAQTLLLESDPAVEGVHPVRVLRRAATPAAAAALTVPGVDASDVSVARIGQEAATGDALLAAIETALDPSGDGDTHDGARVIVLEVTDPRAAQFPGSPVARALVGAEELGAVVVAPPAAAAAAAVVSARPTLAAATVAALLRQVAAPWPGGPPDVAAALAAEVVAEAPAGAPAGSLVVRNSSTRAVHVRLAAREGGIVRPAAMTLAAGTAVTVAVASSAAAGGAASGGAVTVDVSPAGGAPFRVVVPRPLRAGGGQAAAGAAPPTLSLAPGAASPSDAHPARLAVVLPGAVERLDIELLRGGVPLGLVVRLRELLPGRYVLALTGRGPGGERLAPARYILRAVAIAPGGVAAPGAATSRADRSMEWAIRSTR